MVGSFKMERHETHGKNLYKIKNKGDLYPPPVAILNNNEFNSIYYMEDIKHPVT